MRNHTWLTAGLPVILMSVTLLVPSAVAWGQIGGSQAFRPSQQGPLSDLDRSLGRLGGSSGPNYNVNRSSSVAAPPPLPSRSLPRRIPMAQPGNAMQPYSPLTNSQNSWYGKHYNNPWARNSRSYRGRGLSHPEYSPNNQILLLRRGEKPQNPPSDVAVKAAAPNDVVVELPDQAEGTVNQLPLAQLVKNYVGSHRETYLNRGWTEFRQGHYRQACDLFGLAESVTMDDFQARIEVKSALLQASVASRQYAVAVNILRWLLMDDPHTGEMRDSLFLNRIHNVESFYGNKSDYVDHVRAMEELAIAYPASPELKALRAVVLWGKNDRARAVFYAKELAGSSGIPPWTRLHGLMEAAQTDFGHLESIPPASHPAP